MKSKNILFCVFSVFLFLSNPALCDMTKEDKAYAEKVQRAAEEHYKKGINYYKQSKLSLAKAEWEKAVSICPGNKNCAEALKNLEKEKYAGNTDEYCHETIKNFYEEGMKYFRKGEYEKALSEWKKAYMLNPNQKKINEYCEEAREKLKNEESKKADSENKKISLPEPIKVIEYKKEDKKEKKPKKKEKKKEKENNADKKNKSKINELYKEGLRNYQKKKYEKALYLWQEVLKLDPEHEKAQKNILKLKKEIKNK